MYQKNKTMINHKHVPSDSLLKHKLDKTNALAFMLGGKATFTLKSLKTGDHFTYKIFNSTKWEGMKKVSDPDFKFVHLMTGKDNTRSYTYAGFIKRQGRGWVFVVDKGNTAKGRKALVTENTPGIVAFKFVWENFNMGVELPLLEFWSAGTCAGCGRMLTNEKSIELSMGPVCGSRHKALMAELNERIAERRTQAIQKIVVAKQNTTQPLLFTTETMKLKMPVIGKKYKSAVPVDYFVEGRGLNLGHVEGEVVKVVKNQVTLKNQLGNHYNISTSDFVNKNLL
jgi:hypothetical protein